VKARVLGGIGLLAVIAVGLGVWWGSSRQEAAQLVKAAEVGLTPMSQEVYATGTVQMTSRQELRAPVIGLVQKVKVKVGDVVQADQTLVELDGSMAEVQITQAEAAWDIAEANLTLAQENLQALQNPVQVPLEVGAAAAAVRQAELAVDQAEAGVKQAQAGVKMARLQREQLLIKTELTGTVLQVNVREGDYASQQVPLVIVGDLQRLEVVAQLNELDAAKVKVGHKTVITSKALGKTELSGSVTRVAPEALTKAGYSGMATPTVEVGISLANVAKVLKPGFLVNLAILVAAQDVVLAVPLEALFQEGKRSFVYRVEGEKAYKTEVELGIADELNQQVTAGLKAGDAVVLNPSGEFYDGMPVRLAGSEPE